MQIQTTTDLSKSNAEMAAQQIAENSNPLETMVKVKYLETVLDTLKKLVKDGFMAEMDKHPKMKANLLEAEVSVANGYDEPDYEQDATYKQLADQLAARKELLKTAFKVKNQIITDDGEVIPVLPTGKIVADRIIVKLKK